MSFIVPKPNESDFVKILPETGLNPARIYSIIDFGTQDTEFQGEAKKTHQVQISFELPNQLHTFKKELGEQPLSVHKTFTLSLHSKGKLRPFISSYTGITLTDEMAENYDISLLIGRAGMLNIVRAVSKTGSEYANIMSFAPVMKGLNVPEQINPSVLFVIPAKWDDDTQVKFKQLPQFMQDIIMKSYEYRALMTQDTIANSATQVFTQETPKTNVEFTSEIKPEDLPF